MTTKVTELMVSNKIRHTTQKVTQKYAENIEKITSGSKHSDFRSTGVETDKILRIKRAQMRSETFKDITTKLIARTASQVQILERINDFAMNFHVDLQKATGLNNEYTDLKNIASRYKQSLYQLLMSKDSNDRFIFSGQTSDVPPVVQDLAGIAVPPLNSSLSPQDYATGSSEKIEISVYEGQITDIGILADHPGIRDFLQAILIGENYGPSLLDNSTDGLYMKQALQLMEGSTKSLAQATGELGHLQKFLEDVSLIHEKNLQQAENDIAEFIDSDILESYYDASMQEILIQILQKTAYIDDIEDFLHQLKF